MPIPNGFDIISINVVYIMIIIYSIHIICTNSINGEIK